MELAFSVIHSVNSYIIYILFSVFVWDWEICLNTEWLVWCVSEENLKISSPSWFDWPWHIAAPNWSWTCECAQANLRRQKHQVADAVARGRKYSAVQTDVSQEPNGQRERWQKSEEKDNDSGEDRVELCTSRAAPQYTVVFFPPLSLVISYWRSRAANKERKKLQTLI